MSQVELVGVTKTYPNGTRAVRNLDLRIEDGEFLTILGPSGSGKTTLLRLIAGLEALTDGDLRIGGQSIGSLPPWQRDTALVFQRSSLYPHLTVRQNLGFGLRMRQTLGSLLRRWAQTVQPLGGNPMPDAVAVRQIVDDIAGSLDLEAMLDRLPRELSGGQQQRVALGKALVRRPAVYLLDEPLSHLEPTRRAELRRLLHSLHQRYHATILHVTHDQFDALALGGRVAVLAEGTLQQVGPPEEIYHRPRNRFVAGFFGWPPMNFLEGRLDREDGRSRFVRQGWRIPLATDRWTAADRVSSQEIVLGIRPETITLSLEGSKTNSFGMTIRLVELLGGETLVTLEREGVQLTARIPGTPGVAVGQTVAVRFNMETLQLFAPDGQALSVRGPAG